MLALADCQTQFTQLTNYSLHI